MLNQIVMPRAVFAHICNETAHDMKLMKARKQEIFLLRDLLPAVGEQFLFGVDFQAHELLQNVHHAVFLEYSLPEIRSRVAIRIGRIALAAVLTRAVAALIERQEICAFAVEFGRHGGFEQINTEERENAAVEAEA